MKDFCTVTLDIAYDDTLFEAIINLIDGAPIVATITRVFGSAAGWPEVTFAGARDDLLTMLVRYCGGDADLANELEYLVEASDLATWGGHTYR